MVYNARCFFYLCSTLLPSSLDSFFLFFPLPSHQRVSTSLLTTRLHPVICKSRSIATFQSTEVAILRGIIMRLSLYVLLLSTLLLVVTAESFVARPSSSSFLSTSKRHLLPQPCPSLSPGSIDPLLPKRKNVFPVQNAATSHAAAALMEKKGGGAVVLEGTRTLWAKSKVWVFISLWYFFNVAFNIYNKKVRILSLKNLHVFLKCARLRPVLPPLWLSHSRSLSLSHPRV